MKILHVGPVKNSNPGSSVGGDFEILQGLGFDGPSRSILGLTGALAEAGVESGLLSTKSFQVRPGDDLKGVHILTPYVGRKYNPFVQADSWLDRIEGEFGRPDLVNFHDVYDLFSCRLALKMKKRGWPYIVTPRGGLRRVAQRRDKWKKIVANPLFFRRYLRNALFINALAEGEAAEVPLFDSKLKTVIIPNGIPAEILSLSENLPPTKKNGDKIVVGFLGQLFVEIKGIDILLGAIGQLQERGGGKNLMFVLVGPVPRSSDQKWVKRMLKRLSNPDQVVMTGPKLGMEKWKAFDSFDVFILPSRTEGMPVVGLEAMALAKPCIFSRGSNMADIIQKAQGGWDGGETSESICERLIEVSLMSREQLRDMGGNAHAYAARHLTWDEAVRRYLGVIKEYV